MEELLEIPEIAISSQGAENIEALFPSFSFSGFVEELTRGEGAFEAGKIMETLFRVFAGELYGAVKVLAVIMAVVILSAVAETIRQSLGKDGFDAPAIASGAVIFGLGISIFTNTLSYAKSVSGDMTIVMASLLPVIVTLMAGSGYALTGSVAHPVLLLMLNVFANIFDKVLIPVSVGYLSVALLDAIGGAVELGRLKELIKKVYNFMIGLVMTLFTGILSISSFAASGFDSLAAKGAKFAVSAMVPFVGGSVSDALSSVASASAMLKNALGTGGIVMIALLCAVPVIKCAAIILSVRICAALCESVAGKRTIKALSAIADSLSMINSSVIATAVMMIIACAIIIGVK